MKVKVLFVSYFLILFNVCFGQIDNNRYRVILTSEDIGVCGNDNSVSTVEITGKNASCNSFEIVFNLPNGISYIPSTVLVTSQSGSSDYVVSELNITNLNTPVFSVLRPSNGNWAVGDIVTFTFEREADCDAVQFFNNSGIFKDAHTINFNDNNGSNSYTDSDINVANYNIDAASLSIQSLALINANVGGSYTRTIDVDQGGTGDISQFTHYVVVGSDLQNYILSYGGVPLTPSSVSGDTLFYSVDLTSAPFNSSGNGVFELGERMTFSESFDVAGCQNSNVKHHSFWGCSLGEVCQSASPQEGVLNFGVSVPNITLTEIAGRPDFCSPTTFRVRIENTSTTAGGSALNVNLNLGLGHNGSPITTTSSNPLWAFDYQNTRIVANFFFDNGSVFTPANLASSLYPTRGSGNSLTIPPDFFTSDPDGAGIGLEDIDGDGFYDDLAPGATTILNFDYTTNPETGCGNSNYYNYMHWEHVYFDANYQNQCYQDRPSKRVDLDYSNVIRNYLNQTYVDAPTDVFNTEDFNIRIQPHFYIGLACNGASGASGPDVTWTMTLTVPDGVTLQSSAPASFTQTGNTITYVSGSYSYSYINFPLSYNCQVGDCGGTSYVNYVTNYKCGTCYDQDIHCDSIPIVRHCNCPCAGVTTKLFDAKRVSEGWTDPTMSTPVVLNETYNLNNYLAGDTMVIYTKASINNVSLDNLGVDIRYTAPSAGGGVNAVTFVDGEIQIYDFSVNSLSSIGSITTGPTIVSVGDEHLHSFDLSMHTNLISNSNFDDGDSVFVELTYVVLDLIGNNSLHSLDNFRGNFYTISNGNKESCNDLGDVAFYGRVTNGTSNHYPYSAICSNSYTSQFLTHQTNFSDLHPNEYRPPTIWDSCQLILPTGARFTGDAEWIGGGGYSIAGGDIGYVQRGDTVTFFPQGSFINIDQGGTTYKRLRTYFMGTCDTPPSSTYYMTHFYKEFGYGNQISTVKNSSGTFNYTPPTFLFQSPSTLIKGNGNEAVFDTEICNSSTVAINHNWLEIEPNSNITITGAFEVMGGVETPINYSQTGGYIYIEAGSLAVAECRNIRFKASYTTCNQDTLIVKHGWDCSQYPLDYTALTSVCYQDSLEMILAPQEGQIQLSITNQPSGALTLCTPFDVEMDIISAQLADIVTPYLKFNIPGGATGLTINSIQVEYPLNSGASGTFPVTYTISPLGEVQVNIYDHPNIVSQGGVSGTSNSTNINERTAHVIINMQLECDYISNATLRFEAFANSPCGSPALGNGTQVVSNNLLINGALPPYDAFSTITNLIPVGNTQAFNVVTTIIGGTTGTEDSAFIELPVGLNYIPNSFSTNGVNLAVFGGVYTVGNRQEILIKYPQGVPHNGTIEFSFNTTANHSVCSEIHITNFVTINGLSCLSVSCIDARVLTGFSYENVELKYIGLAGNNQSLCAQYNTLLDGLEPPVTETGIWYIDSSYSQPNMPIFADSSVHNTGLSNLIEGTYQIIWAVSNSTCPIVRDTIEITVYDQPFASAGPDQDLCSLDTTILAANQPIGTASGSWSMDTTFTQPSIITFVDETQFNTSVSNLQEGIYKLVWTVSNGTCVSATDTVEIRVYDQPFANAGINQKLCEEFTSVLDGNQPVGTANGYWMLDTSFNQANILSFNDSTIFNTGVSSLTIGDYQLIWTLENGVCAVSKDTVNLSVYTFPVAHAGEDTIIKCVPPSIYLNGGASSQGGSYEYVWSTFDGDIISDPTTLTPEISAEGNYVLTVLDTVSGCISNDTILVIGDYSASVTIWFNNSSDSIADINTLENYEFLYQGDSGDVIWSVNNDNITSDSILNYSFVESGQYIVDILLTNLNNGCTATDSIILTAIHQLKIPEGVSPNGDGYNDYFEIKALENYDDNSLIIFNRWGNAVFTASPYENDWRGQSNSEFIVTGKEVVDGTYFYVLKLIKDNKEFVYKGAIELKRQ